MLLKQFYRTIHRTFGYPLTEGTAMPSKLLLTAEKRLGARIPKALRDYYLVAGRERRFNKCHNRLLTPQEWSLDKQRLIFMEENQSVVWWGVSIRDPDLDDPSVFQGINDEPITWVREHKNCSVFLAVMLHYQAVSGGFRLCGMANAPSDIRERLQSGWTYYGEINTLRAYSRPNQVVCVMLPGDHPFMQNVTILAGAKTKRDLRAIAGDLGVSLT